MTRAEVRKVQRDVTYMLGMFRHGLTWHGRIAAVYYRVRRVFVAPAPPATRCIMGYPVGEIVRCPRRSVADELWCSRHMPKAST